MLNGIININKEKGYTSHDVVAKLRGILKQKKIGHTGTLDPNACGVLPVCLGKATKLCDLLTDKDKIYEAVLLLGMETDTQDAQGKILNKIETEKLLQKITSEQVEEVITSFVGEYDQIPPMYSAIKIDGKKLYELAREGKEIERKARKVHIKSIEIKSVRLPRVEIRVHCTKGTYIRTLCHDIGNVLGCGGCMEELIRIKVERFTIEDSLTLSDVEYLVNQNDIDRAILPIDEVFIQYPKAIVLDKYSKLLYNGNALKKEHFKFVSENCSDDFIRIYDENNTFVALYKCCIDNTNLIFKNVKMFLDK